MARIRPSKVKEMASSGGFFTLKDDGDSALVRFLYEDKEDLYGYSVHEVEVGNGTRYVDCLREEGDKPHVCPLCSDGHRPVGRFFLKLMNEETDEVMIWERGNTIWGVLEQRLRRVKGPVCGTVFEITRIGRAGDPKTTYDIYPIEDDGCLLEDLPDASQVVGSVVLEKTEEEIEDYLDTGSFEDDNKVQDRRSSRGGNDRGGRGGRTVSRREARDEEPAPRRARSKRDEEDDVEEAPTRRARKRDEEDDVEEKPARRTRTREEEAPARRTRKRDVEEDEEDEPAPKRRGRKTEVEEDDEVEEKPARRSRKPKVEEPDDELDDFDGDNFPEDLEDLGDDGEDEEVEEAPKRGRGRGRRSN